MLLLPAFLPAVFYSLLLIPQIRQQEKFRFSTLIEMPDVQFRREFRISKASFRKLNSVHNSTIFKSSSIYAELRESHGQGYLLEDAGYEIDTFIMIPYRKGSAESAERKRFNKCHAATRNPIERTFGCWKSKFRCLQGMAITLDTALSVMTAFAVLW